MLVIISDVHLTDGSLGDTAHEGTLRVFRERLRHLAYAASWRADGTYRPITSLSIILLGDIIDVLRSSQWLEETRQGAPVRPWSDPQDPCYAQKIEAITDRILERNAVFFSLLRDLRRASIATVPRATRAGRPEVARRRGRRRERAAVEVRIHYMVGNHDWYFHLPYPSFNGIRQKLVRALGLDNDPARPFPHDPGEPAATAILEALREHSVFARHGDIFDPINYAGDRDGSSLGDAIITDLLLKFVTEVRAQLGRSMPPRCLAEFNEIDNVRPILLAPVWIGGILRAACPDAGLRRRVQGVWNDVAAEFFRIPFVRDRLKAQRSQISTEKLRILLTLSTKALLPGSVRVLRWLGKQPGIQGRSYCRYALSDAAFQRSRARYIVYGHTHRHEMAALDGATSVASADARIYFNSGTWRPVYELARRQPANEPFAGYNTMTYIAFFKDDERSGRAFETWSGSLCRSTAARARVR